MQAICPEEFKEDFIKYELGFRINWANVPTEEGSHILGC